MILEEQDSGKTVELVAGNIFTIRLKESPTTGYRWMVESAHGLEQVSDRFEAGSAVGEAGVRVFQFRAPHSGLYELSMKNRREWDREDTVHRRFGARIVVE